MEARIATGEYLSIEIGDTIDFICGTKTQTCKVVHKAKYNSFEKMLKSEGINKCLPGVNDFAEAVTFYRSLSNYASLELTYGVVDFRLEPKV